MDYKWQHVVACCNPKREARVFFAELGGLLPLALPQAAHAGLALKNPLGWSGGFVEYTVADAFKARPNPRWPMTC